MRERTDLEERLGAVARLGRELDDAVTMVELGEAEKDAEAEKEGLTMLRALEAECQRRQIDTLLSGEADANDTYVEIHSGAGGTESCDWALMLERMYTRWADKQGYKVEELEVTDGDEAGIKSATLLVKGHNAHGWMKTESGVHRLVRISPFDSNARRHTSFASVWVYPVVDDRIDIQINESDCRIDTYRASGAGGQHVNKTESAVQIIHKPTGIMVYCADERSQLRNRQKALRVLRSRLLEMTRAKEREARAQDRKTQVGSGDRSERIRTYNFPQNRITDHRIDLTVHGIEQVLEGDLDELVNALYEADIRSRAEAITRPGA